MGSVPTLLPTSHDVFEVVYRDLFIRGEIDAHVNGEEVVDLSLAYKEDKGDRFMRCSYLLRYLAEKSLAVILTLLCSLFMPKLLPYIFRRITDLIY